ncbi:unnamed protein product [Heligmosomoides polygyrus]|uniref:HORMA domain-containing protein n=1 Tax=Heligmosomoides polygyrus TaxID=6339 RepID=A0A3P8B639_HELPZ|nr:unnamed protein product [Heligmosomoides polygyrus]
MVSIVHYKFLKTEETITAEKYRAEIELLTKIVINIITADVSASSSEYSFQLRVSGGPTSSTSKPPEYVQRTLASSCKVSLDLEGGVPEG